VEFSSSSPEETEEVAGALARRLETGDVVTVSGELGSGKTVFVRGACRALGVTSTVTSPSYAIGHLYENGRRVSHLDLYRFRSVSEAEWGDLEPYFSDAIVFVEWPEAGAGALPPLRAEVSIEHGGGTKRRITIDSADPSLIEGLRR
jgi:tRNA threonylcarbamoyladenosine biosynthesis protein TsaE